MRHSGVTVMVSSAYPSGITEPEYNRLIDTDPKARRMSWRRMVRDAQVYARVCAIVTTRPFTWMVGIAST